MRKLRVKRSLNVDELLLVDGLPKRDSVLTPLGEVRKDIPLGMRFHLENAMKVKPQRSMGGYRSKQLEPDRGKSVYEDIPALSSSVVEYEKKHGQVAHTNKPKWVSNASYGDDLNFIKGYVKHSENRDLSGLLSLTPAASAVDSFNAAKEFIANPSLESAARIAVAAIPGKMADKVVDAIPTNKIIKKPEKKTKEKIVKPVVKEKAGEKGSWNKALQNPKPNTIYEVECVHHGKKVFYTYETDELGRTISVKGQLELSPIASKERNDLKRHPKGQIKYGGDIAKSEGNIGSYDGGHAVGTVFMGPAEKINIVPQLSKQNRHGGWASMEREWRKNLKDDQPVDVEIKFAYDGDSKVPSKIFGSHSINGVDDEFMFPN
ncbi:DNA/RNA non-specific endonuclease [Aliivibrio fischeri]|uniref:DNA/RNA non-specific endonuclease n=1 Tax=Aliivibrio fischeri TaxID=668 RepID=UPI0018C66A6A|nr:DNA/RNA non-specific endonuclease [Aliivibrio fischeri]